MTRSCYFILLDRHYWKSGFQVNWAKKSSIEFSGLARAIEKSVASATTSIQHFGRDRFIELYRTLQLVRQQISIR